MDWLADITISKLETGECSHRRESPATGRLLPCGT
jgi:hypothetical protein